MIRQCGWLFWCTISLFAQGPGVLPDVSDAQATAAAALTAETASPVASLSEMRKQITAAAYTGSANRGALQSAAQAIGEAEYKLAVTRAEWFTRVQHSASAWSAKEAAALVARNGIVTPPAANRYAGRGTIPGIREAQVSALTHLSTELMPLSRRLSEARARLVQQTFTLPTDVAALRAAAGEIEAAEKAVAEARASSFNAIQNSRNRLSPQQVQAFLDMGGSFAGVNFTHPEPLNFADHAGYVPLFDGRTLKGWDGNPKFWRVEEGAIVGESTAQNPSGNSYLVYRDLEAKDFTLKFEIKVEGTGGSGLQYRSRTGLPWLANIPANVTANVGPVNLNWMMTGPQADFWPASKDWTGQFYSENTPMRILAWRGDVVEGSGLARKQLMGTINDREVLGRTVRMNDWNEYTVIARGGTLIQIINGQLMAVMVDDDPESSNNQSGLFGIEIEATTKISVRNIWCRKLN